MSYTPGSSKFIGAHKVASGDWENFTIRDYVRDVKHSVVKLSKAVRTKLGV